MILKKRSADDSRSPHAICLMRYCETLSEARYTFVNLFFCKIPSSVQGGCSLARRRKKTCWRSDANFQKVLKTFVGRRPGGIPGGARLSFKSSLGAVSV